MYASLEGRTARIRLKIEELEIPFVLLTKGYSGYAAADRIDVELDRSVAERDAFQYRIAAVQSLQAIIENPAAGGTSRSPWSASCQWSW